MIRAAHPGDGKGLAHAANDLASQYIELDSERFKYPEGDLVVWLEAELEKPVAADQIWLVAEVEGEVVGGVEASVLEPMPDAEIQSQRDVGLRRVYVSYLAVQAAMRSQGIGSRLMGEVEQWARSKGAEPILTDTNLRSDSVRFFEQNGFAQQSVILRKRLR